MGVRRISVKRGLGRQSCPKEKERKREREKERKREKKKKRKRERENRKKKKEKREKEKEGRKEGSKREAASSPPLWVAPVPYP